MAEYIEREAALEICQKEYEERLRMGDYCGDTAAWNIGGAIKGLPAEDVSPVVRGRWINDNAGVVCCSECGEEHEWEDYRASYCDTCGAKMKEANGND